MYFVRIDFTYKGYNVQRTRDIVDDFSDAVQLLNTMLKDGYCVLQVKLEHCF